MAHGLWSKDYKYIVDEIKTYGFSTIRLPFSNEMWELNPVPTNVAGCAECKGKRARDIMAMIVNYAALSAAAVFASEVAFWIAGGSAAAAGGAGVAGTAEEGSGATDAGFSSRATASGVGVLRGTAIHKAAAVAAVASGTAQPRCHRRQIDSMAGVGAAGVA